MGLIPETLDDWYELAELFGYWTVSELWPLRDFLAWMDSRKSTPLSGGGSRQDSLPRSSETSSSGFRDNREATPVEVRKGGEHDA